MLVGEVIVLPCSRGHKINMGFRLNSTLWNCAVQWSQSTKPSDFSEMGNYKVNNPMAEVVMGEYVSVFLRVAEEKTKSVSIPRVN